MKKLLFPKLFILALLFVSFYGNGQVVTPFSKIYQVTQKGGILFLANASLGCAVNPPLGPTTCSNGVNQVPPTGSYADNNFSSVYIDIDNDPTTYMSSSDSLNLPDCSGITKAYLFWGANGTSSTANRNAIKMKINNGTYQTVVATYSSINTAGYNTYHCYADVTTLLQGGGIKSRVTVANIPTGSLGSTNTFGSWNLVVVYNNDLLTMRQLTVFNGLANVSTGSAATVNVPVAGFLTPLSGPVTFEVGVYTHDGDRALTGDNLNFNGGTGFLPVIDALNPLGDVMNSTVSNKGVLTPFRVPDMNNTAGLDADIFAPDNTLKTYLGNSITSATFQMTTSSETYLAQMITTAIDVYEPDIRASVKVKDINGGAVEPGDILEYRVKGLNIGSDPSINSFITDTLDRNIVYMPNSIKIVHGPNLGLKTDAGGDDQAEFVAADRLIRVRIGTGANGVTGGTILNSTAGADSTVFTYSVMATTNCVKLSCDDIIDARAFIWGTGNVSGNTFNNGSNPGIFDVFGCPIPGITSTPINAAACVAPTASVNPASVCTTGSFSLSATTNTDVTYAWSGPAGFTSPVQNPVVTNATAAKAGVYTVSLIAYPGCVQTATTNISINNCPIAAPDASNTAINTPVSGNAGANDTNTSGATFSIITQPANGTVTINTSTGDYTFTPAPTFTGVTTATYQICNGSPVVCVTSGMTFTVYPNLTAVANSLTTTPTASVSGNLTTNDIGVTAGAVYSVSVTQPSTSTGTLTVNSTTGQYTFTPNASFNGTTATTYTICNTSINPQQCSSTTINISVGSSPAAVNDAASTLINTAVSGSAAANDTGTITGVFSIITQPAATSGTVSINPSTGVYTFTPTTGFTGTAQATYELCNVVSPPCATANIIFTVYPNVTAVSNTVNTTPSVTATGSLLTNDLGVTPGANYSVSITQPPTTTGTITVNPSTGEYTFVPNPAFTGTSSATYTVCNTSINPQQCSNTSINIIVGNTPLAVNDATNTVINTPVTANAASNDNGVVTATFAVISQPATTSGTVSINPSTGVYTFTPATGFTGTAQATYQLCNVLSPPCATANITFTVYPNIVANSNSVITMPSVTATGSLLTNDLGITPGANYSVSITQPPTTTGTITINPSTGEYTFVPNPAFTGSSSASYTVCNTSVNPQQCSNTSISISVGNTPLAVNDATNTVINTPVTANASTNDGGILTGTFVITAQPAATSGTVSINPSTGVYTFTPATGFTGTTQATYQLCNLLSPPCATANITFTVYPNLTAVANTVATTPSVSTTGNLTTNDLGITPGANYSVSVTQPPASTGTITINTSTGQYTFAPNPAFTGTDVASYTICNTSVNPQQCSNTNINIIVANTPLAVNDATNTLINTPVTASAATNDSGVLTATFAIAAQPAVTSGTVAINPATGVYTFTPATGFTGTAQATYQLCNALSPPCATANITFTVYPNLTAVSNTINTVPTVSVTGNLLTNDIGITTGADYSVSVTQPAAGTGTINFNPATGNYTFVPNATFTGSATTSYTVCNNSVNPQQCSNTAIVIFVGNMPVAVNDATNTAINTAVSGNVATNDSGVLTGSFTIVTPPANGTMTLNASTGAFSFTPATGFTGVTTATYQLCNVLSPPCSTAAVTFTVYPNIVANPNVISTTPGVATSTNLLTNDGGITPGANYSVSITPLLSTTGTLVVNPSTGVASFTPATGFTGTVQTTYTVCNTSINPQQCSNTTITLNVVPAPVAVNDATTTVINTAVTATAATNDTGVLTGTFTVITPPANGTMTMNPVTGVYSFTPATGFTGVTTATYQLCNAIAAPCGTASITFTVYPNLIAANDNTVAVPNVVLTGSLLTNDAGIVTGGNYTVNIAPVLPAVGTITVNPVTGVYSFTPAASFNGTITTTYTVCNLSVNPVICSNASLTISTGAMAVNDATTTAINTQVSGTVATNDINAGGGTFTVTTPSANGTFTLNQATGQYTFIPATGFTGTTMVVYQLCNGSPSVCSNATVNITVFPDITAMPDVINTTPSVTATGTLTPNDPGAVSTTTLGGTYSVSIAQFPPSTGTLIVIPGTGQYTFVPDPSFTGTATTTYTICNTSINPQQCSTSTITVNVVPPPVAVDDATITIANTPVVASVTGNDTGLLTATLSIISQPADGSITIDPASGQYTFVPTTGFAGTTIAIYQLCNFASPPCATAAIVFTVYPAVVSNTSTTFAGNPVSGNASTGNTPNTGLAYGTPSVAGASNGTMVIAANGSYTFTPAASFTGTTHYLVPVCNNTVVPPVCSVDTIYVNVLPGLVPETLTVTSISTTTGNVLTNEPISIQNGTVTTTPVSGPSHGTFTITPNGNFTYTPNNPDYCGYDVIVVTVCTGTICTTNTINIAVYPNLQPNTSTTPVNTPVAGNASAGNTPSAGLTYGTPAPVGSVAGGTMTMLADGQYTFTPALNFTGTVQYVVTVCNNTVTPPICRNDTINIIVIPGLVPETLTVTTGGSVTGNVLTNEPVSVQAGTVSTTPLSGPHHGTINILPNGNFTYTANNPNFSGYDTVLVTVCVGTVCATNTIIVTVYPALGNDTGTTTPGSATVTGNVLTNDHGTGLTLNPTPVVNPTHGTLTLDPNGTYTYTAQQNYCGVDSFAYKVCDSSIPALCQTAWVVVNIPCDDEVFVPQGISPNGDGANDVLGVTGIEKYPENKITIFNRWGNVVFEGNAAIDKWDGTSNKGTSVGDNKLPVGTYFYILDLKTDGKKNLKGYIYLQR